jgi:hypothetical protein
MHGATIKMTKGCFSFICLRALYRLPVLRIINSEQYGAQKEVVVIYLVQCPRFVRRDWGEPRRTLGKNSVLFNKRVRRARFLQGKVKWKWNELWVRRHLKGRGRAMFPRNISETNELHFPGWPVAMPRYEPDYLLTQNLLPLLPAFQHIRHRNSQMVTGSSNKSANIILLELIKKHKWYCSKNTMSIKTRTAAQWTGCIITTRKRLGALWTGCINTTTFTGSMDWMYQHENF